MSVSKIFRRRPEGRFGDRLHSDEERNKQDLPHENEPMQKEDTSLGLLDNMSGTYKDKVLRIHASNASNINAMSMTDLTSISAMGDEQKLNYPNLDADLENARKLLQRCSCTRNSLTTGK